MSSQTASTHRSLDTSARSDHKLRIPTWTCGWRNTAQQGCYRQESFALRLRPEGCPVAPGVLVALYQATLRRSSLGVAAAAVEPAGAVLFDLLDSSFRSCKAFNLTCGQSAIALLGVSRTKARLETVTGLQAKASAASNAISLTRCIVRNARRCLKYSSVHRRMYW
ncbi:hypothetical protein KC358_g54 [Hortaea werneckii]|nr:hypothetical protein KC358_g54 [Hortaea werneckii]